jgi:hypothetical protein
MTRRYSVSASRIAVGRSIPAWMTLDSPVSGVVKVPLTWPFAPQRHRLVSGRGRMDPAGHSLSVPGLDRTTSRRAHRGQVPGGGDRDRVAGDGRREVLASRSGIPKTERFGPRSCHWRFCSTGSRRSCGAGPTTSNTACPRRPSTTSAATRGVGCCCGSAVNTAMRNWKWIRRRYLPGWWPTDGDATLFDPGKVTVSRYRPRADIPTPWSTVRPATVPSA